MSKRQPITAIQLKANIEHYIMKHDDVLSEEDRYHAHEFMCRLDELADVDELMDELSGNY